MFESSVSKDMSKNDIIWEVAEWKAVAHLCLTLIVKELKISVEHGRVVTTLNIILFSVVETMSKRTTSGLFLWT